MLLVTVRGPKRDRAILFAVQRDPTPTLPGSQQRGIRYLIPATPLQQLIGLDQSMQIVNLSESLVFKASLLLLPHKVFDLIKTHCLVAALVIKKIMVMVLELKRNGHHREFHFEVAHRI